MVIPQATGTLAAQAQPRRLRAVSQGKEDGKTTVEFGPLVTLGISTSFGLFLKAFQDGKAIYDPGDKITLKDGRWTPRSRSQFRINLNDISAIYQEVREVDLRRSTI